MRKWIRTMICLCFLSAMIQPAQAYGADSAHHTVNNAYSLSPSQIVMNYANAFNWKTDNIDLYKWIGDDGREHIRYTNGKQVDTYEDILEYLQEQLILDGYNLDWTDGVVSPVSGGGYYSGISRGYVRKERKDGSKIVEAARKEIGESEKPNGSNIVKYNVRAMPWAANFICWLGDQVYGGKNVLPSAGYLGMTCEELHRQLTSMYGSSANIRNNSIPSLGGGGGKIEAGDIIFWKDTTRPLGKQYCNVGIVSNVTENTIMVIYGDSTAGKVVEITVNKSNAQNSKTFWNGDYFKIDYPFAFDTDGEEHDIIIAYCMDELGLNEAATCGVLGNLRNESGLIPYCLELGNYSIIDDITYTELIDDETISRENFLNTLEREGCYDDEGTFLRGVSPFRYGGGYGLIQWTLNTRKALLYDTCKSYGESISSTACQMMTMDEELSQPEYSNTVPLLLGVPNTEDGVIQATEIWNDNYEIGEDGARKQYALEEWYAWGAEAAAKSQKG